MRLRRFLARRFSGAVVAGVMAAGATAGYAQNGGGTGSIQVLDAASTAAIANAVQQLAGLSLSGYARSTGSGVANAVTRGAQSSASTGGTLVASVLQSSDFILELPTGPAGSNGSTKQHGTGQNLVLAQFN